MICYADLVTRNGGGVTVMTYANGTPTFTGTRVSMETGAGYWALKIDGDYSMVYDGDGLLAGDYDAAFTQDLPRLDFYSYTINGKNRMASLSKNGLLMTAKVQESSTLPTRGIVLGNTVSITPSGVYTTKANEVWFLTDENDRYICSEGLLLQVR